MLEIAVVIVACIVVGNLVFRRLFRQRPAQPRSGISYSTAASLRSYDPSAYRFDGIARRQFRIEYADVDGVVTERDIFVHNWKDQGSYQLLDCWCYLRDERRSFRTDRMLSIVNLATNRPIKDIVRYLSR